MTIPFTKGQKVRFRARVGELRMEIDAIAQEGGWTGVAANFPLTFFFKGQERTYRVPGKNIFMVYRDPLVSAPQTDEA